MPALKVCLDTNILIYALGEGTKADVAQALLQEPFLVSVQALNECINVCRRKLGLDWPDIRLAVEQFETLAQRILPIEPVDTSEAMQLAMDHRISFYDALMLAVALRSGCESFYSEDLQHGWQLAGGMRVIDPFRL
ncbi:MAG: PIN domain-containing protein [Rhizobium sp.]|nr:PIN domain-containing protein [Rhizobium sp.]MCZ8349768.1 PIN domain-containing protein [Rhizobium sp.]